MSDMGQDSGQGHEHERDHEHGHAHGHAREHEHGHAHDHDHGDARGPLADASVRRARPADAPAVGLVQADVWTGAYAGRIPAEVAERFQPAAFATAWRDSLAEPPPGAHALYVALAGDQVVGFLAVGPSQDPDAPVDLAEFTALGVHRSGRRQGHGSRLLNAGVDHLRAAGAGSVAAWVLVDDEPTRAFLSGAGFEPDGAYRDRVVSAAGQTLREVRLSCSLGE